MSETSNASTLRWMKLTEYCQRTGDTADAVHAKRRKGQWIDGIHCTVAPDGNLWVNPEEVNKWVESGETAGQKPSQARSARSFAHAA